MREIERQTGCGTSRIRRRGSYRATPSAPDLKRYSQICFSFPTGSLGVAQAERSCNEILASVVFQLFRAI